MEKTLNTLTNEERLFVSAIHQEIFNRIFPTIRHDLVGYLSASLMRVSIMDRYLNKQDVLPNLLKHELIKIDTQLRSSIVEIRALEFWDFESKQNDNSNDVLIKSVQLMTTQLAMKNIKLNIIPEEIDASNEVVTKPFLYCLLCTLCYIEDKNFDNKDLLIRHTANSIEIVIDPKEMITGTTFMKSRNLTISKEVAMKFINLHDMKMSFNNEDIKLTW